jgi:hypothetical protein
MGRPALYLAAFGRHEAVVRLLLGNGADVAAVNFSREKEVRMTCLILLTREMLATYNNE